MNKKEIYELSWVIQYIAFHAGLPAFVYFWGYLHILPDFSNGLLACITILLFFNALMRVEFDTKKNKVSACGSCGYIDRPVADGFHAACRSCGSLSDLVPLEKVPGLKKFSNDFVIKYKKDKMIF